MKKLKIKTIQILLLFLIVACAQIKEDVQIKEFRTFTFENELGDSCTVGDLLNLENSSENFKNNVYTLTVNDGGTFVYFLELEKIEGTITPIRYGVNNVEYINWKSFSLRVYTIYNGQMYGDVATQIITTKLKKTKI